MLYSIVIFENDGKLRDSLKAVLESSGEYVVSGAYAGVKELNTIIKDERPDVVVLDAGMPAGIDAIATIKMERPESQVLVYTSFMNEEKLFKCFCRGANGFLLKGTSLLEVYEGIKEMINGGAPMSPSIAKLVLESFRKPSKTNEEKYNLTDREIEVLKLLIKGHSVKRIASELNMAFETSRSHLKNIYQKLNVHCGKEAIAKVFTEKINLK